MMKILNAKKDLNFLQRQRVKTYQKTLLLDYDGTLAPFHIDPKEAYPYPGIREMLNNILRMQDIHLVIVTGRWKRDLRPLLSLEKQPEIWGCHGLERLKIDGTYEIATMDEKSLNGLVVADEWTEAVGLSSRSEKKPGCLAIHWRGLGENNTSALRKQVEPEWSLIAKSWGLNLREFDGGLELRVPARNKGDAVKTVLEEMEKETIVAYLGDDLTDEDAFKAIKGHGIGILVREKLRPTTADIWIKPPDELIAFLSDWISESRKSHLFR